MLCQDCPTRNSCLKLCDDAEEYVGQDEPHYHLAGEVHFTRIEKKILHALLDGKSRSQIRKQLNLSAVTMRKHVENLRKKREEIDL
jgi:DNA-binding NarL/FixJ family response regulator